MGTSSSENRDDVPPEESGRKFKHQLDKKIAEDDSKFGGDKDWDKDMDEEFVQELAPADIQELFDKVDKMGKNKAMIRFADGTFSDEIGPSKLGDALSEAEEAETVLINGWYRRRS